MKISRTGQKLIAGAVLTAMLLGFAVVEAEAQRGQEQGSPAPGGAQQDRSGRGGSQRANPAPAADSSVGGSSRGTRGAARGGQSDSSTGGAASPGRAPGQGRGGANFDRGAGTSPTDSPSAPRSDSPRGVRGPNTTNPRGSSAGARGSSGRGPSNGNNAEIPRSDQPASAGGRPEPRGGVNPAAPDAPRGVRPAGSGRGSAPRGGGGQVTPRGTYAGRPGDQQIQLPNGRTEWRGRGGQTVRTNEQGQIIRIERDRGKDGKIAVNRLSRGERTVVTGVRGSRTVSYGPNRGFVERSVRPGYVSRTYIGAGRPYAHVYREYRYHGIPYYHYVPAFYYGPHFYSWVMAPWRAPVPYAWVGIGGPAPWFGYYAGYFAPYPSYNSAYFWLTDYLLAENLRLAYENQQASLRSRPAAPASDSQEPPLSPAVKALIAEEVKQQLQVETVASSRSLTYEEPELASGGDRLPAALKQRFFVVSSNLDVTSGGRACSLTPGDIVQRQSKELAADGTVVAEVVSSKPGNCPADSVFPIAVDELQEMHNQFREQIDAGLKMLAENQANGLPAAPPSEARTVVEGTAPPAADAEARLAAGEAAAAELEAQLP